MTLYYLQDQEPYRMKANAFGVSKSTMSVTLPFVVEPIIKILEPQYIHLPSTRFEVKIGEVLGCGDGTQMPIIQP